MAPGKGAERHQWLQRYAEATVEEIPAVLQVTTQAGPAQPEDYAGE